MSLWLEGKETKVVLQQAATETQTIVQQNANEARVTMQQAINNVEEVERSSPTGVLPFLFPKLSLPHREAVATGPSKVAFPTGSFDQPQHCPPGPTRGDGDVVFRMRDLQEMEIEPFSLMGTRETYVFIHSLLCIPSTLVFRTSGVWQERPLVGSLWFPRSISLP
jgi:hypothetical protein